MRGKNKKKKKKPRKRRLLGKWVDHLATWTNLLLTRRRKQKKIKKKLINVKMERGEPRDEQLLANLLESIGSIPFLCAGGW